MEPELVAGLEIWDGGDGQGDAGAGDADVDLWAGEIEARLGEGRDGGKQKGCSEDVEQTAHDSSLDAFVRPGRGRVFCAVRAAYPKAALQTVELIGAGEAGSRRRVLFHALGAGTGLRSTPAEAGSDVREERFHHVNAIRDAQLIRDR